MSQQQQRKSAYRPSPAGLAQYPWVNKADTKFNADGVFKTGLIVSGEAAEKFKATIDADAQAAFEVETEGLTPGERKKWGVYTPYSVEEDEAGNPTGRIIFHFKQNATITVEGQRKAIQIAVFNAKDEPMAIPVWGGDEIRVMYKPRNTKITSAKKAGVRLDFLKVQVIKKASRDSSPGGFGAVEGGYTGEEEGSYDGGTNTPGDTSGDY